MGQPSETVGARWRALLAEPQQSGQSAAAFRERGLRDGPFYEWKKRLHSAETSPFVAVEVAAAEMPCALGHAAYVPTPEVNSAAGTQREECPGLRKSRHGEQVTTYERLS